jgi:hypothetical protein
MFTMRVVRTIPHVMNRIAGVAQRSGRTLPFSNSVKILYFSLPVPFLNCRKRHPDYVLEVTPVQSKSSISLTKTIQKLKRTQKLEFVQATNVNFVCRCTVGHQLHWLRGSYLLMAITNSQLSTKLALNCTTF